MEILSICLAIGFLGLLAYLYFHEKSEREYISKIQTDLTNLPLQLQKFYTELSAKDNARTQKLIGDSFTKYLKHIEKLERMTLPSPVTERDVKKVMSRIGTIADEKMEKELWDNEIEKAEPGVEMPVNDWAQIINADTKVAFEDDMPTVIEQ